MSSSPAINPRVRLSGRYAIRRFIPVGSSFNIGDFSASETASIRAKLTTTLTNYVESSRHTVTDDGSVAENFAYTHMSSSEEKPENRHSSVRIKEGVSNRDFKKRSVAGEIIMSDYEVGNITVIQTPGFWATSVDTLGASLYGENMLDVVGGRHVPGWGIVIDENVFLLCPEGAISGNALAYYDRTVYRSPVWEFDSPLSADAVAQSLSSFQPDATDLVTRVTARINRSSVDTLTAFAEAPKAISSVLKGFKEIVRLKRDAEKRVFSITKAHDKRQRVFTDRYKSRISRLRREISNPRISPRRKIALEAELRRRSLDHESYIRRSIIELTDAIADVWMNYRYNIMPNVYLAQDVYDAVDKYNREWLTKRDFTSLSGSFPVGNYRIEFSGMLRFMIKRSFSSRSAGQGASVISNDIFVTAWELVPFSWMYDWILNIGDLLSAQQYFPRWDQEGASLARKIEFDTQVSNHRSVKWIVEPSTVVRGSHYKRLKINPSQYCGLVFKPSVGLERQLDTLAVLWRPVRSNFLNRMKKR